MFAAGKPHRTGAAGWLRHLGVLGVAQAWRKAESEHEVSVRAIEGLLIVVTLVEESSKH